MDKKDFIEAGKIVNTHGVAGEVKIEVWLNSAKFMKRFKRLFVGEKEFEILGAKEHKGFFIAKLKGVDDINAAMPLKGREVKVLKSDAKLPAGKFFLQDIIGAKVVDENEQEIGILTEIMETPASMIYVVKGLQEHLIPAVPEFIISSDAEAGIVKVRLIEGM